eukprot:GHVQ01011714.1.p1 GENE.GHVQ01011714.1~~GHVQ01011714.1.p1  ORF type:complete len:583 (-),score=101.14 GHVQ01011714.1:510-2258(-)
MYTYTCTICYSLQLNQSICLCLSLLSLYLYISFSLSLSPSNSITFSSHTYLSIWQTTILHIPCPCVCDNPLCPLLMSITAAITQCLSRHTLRLPHGFCSTYRSSLLPSLCYNGYRRNKEHEEGEEVRQLSVGHVGIGRWDESGGAMGRVRVGVCLEDRDAGLRRRRRREMATVGHESNTLRQTYMNGLVSVMDRGGGRGGYHGAVNNIIYFDKGNSCMSNHKSYSYVIGGDKIVSVCTDNDGVCTDNNSVSTDNDGVCTDNNSVSTDHRGARRCRNVFPLMSTCPRAVDTCKLHKLFVVTGTVQTAWGYATSTNSTTPSTARTTPTTIMRRLISTSSNSIEERASGLSSAKKMRTAQHMRADVSIDGIDNNTVIDGIDNNTVIDGIDNNTVIDGIDNNTVIDGIDNNTVIDERVVFDMFGDDTRWDETNVRMSQEEGKMKKKSLDNNNVKDKGNEENRMRDSYVCLTERAAQKLKAMFSAHTVRDNTVRPIDPSIRVRVSSGGCAGFQYEFSLVKETSDITRHDSITLDKGCQIVVDNESQEFLNGCTIEYIDELIQSGFQISVNKSAASTCSCGHSFDVAG